MRSPEPSTPYQPTIGTFAELVRAGSGHEATSARRVAEVVRDLAGRDDAPLRLLLGTDAVPLAQQAARELAASDEAWREVSLSVSDGTPRQTRSVSDDALVSIADHQTLRVLEGRYVLQRAGSDPAVAGDGDVLAVVRGPDGGACMRRQDTDDDAWVALWNGDAAHLPDAPGMLAAIVAPLAAGQVPVWVAASFDGDLVLIPVDQMDEASELLRRAGHRVIG
jgi:hypothetical protein